MAVLTNCDLSLEIKPIKKYSGIIYLEIYFKYKDKNVFNKDIFTKDNKNCSFYVEDDAVPSFLSLLQKALDTNQPDYWDSIEPRVVIGIYPNLEFPFLKRHETEKGNYFLTSKNNDIKWFSLKSLDHEEKDKDFYTIIVRPDTDGFDYDGISFQGVSLILTVDRDELEKFVEELEFECKNAKHYDPKAIS